MLYTYSFANARRNLADIFSSVIKDEPRFISNFKHVADATARKHKWFEDQISGRAVTALSASDNTLILSAGEGKKLRLGTLVTLKGDSALFAVKSINNDEVTVELASANGSTLSAPPAEGGIFQIVSTPMDEATVNGYGEENCVFAEVNYNCTQIFRKEIVLSGSALAVGVFGSADNQLNRQTAVALSDLSRDLNRVALFGRRIEASAGVRGEAGGLYYFATGDGALEIDAQSAILDSYLVNDAAKMVMAEGGEPMQILCSPGQARVISCEYKDRLQILRSDDRRGAYVAVIVNEINGRGLTVMADPDVPDTDCWLIDPSGFGLSNLRGRAISDSDSTPKGFDGIRRTALGELTFEFKNAKQRCCRIKNLKSSYEVLKGLKTK
jgi:hypothetical protein